MTALAEPVRGRVVTPAELLTLADRPPPPVIPAQTAVDDPRPVVPAGPPEPLFPLPPAPADTAH